MDLAKGVGIFGLFVLGGLAAALLFDRRDRLGGAAVPSADRQTPVSIEVPASAFRAGSNTIAVEQHLDWKSQPTAGFGLRLTGQQA